MSVPTFVDMQGFIVGENFVVKEVAMLQRGCILTHYIFKSPMPWRVLTKSERSQASWLTTHHHGLLWEDGHVPYGMARRLIAAALKNTAVDENHLVYVKGHEKREWLTRLLYDGGDYAENDLVVRSLDDDYDDITS